MSGSASALPRYSISGYRNKIRTTTSRVLLVEGAYDKRAFLRLFHEGRQVGLFDPEAFAVIIDTAEAMIKAEEDAVGNREKVEAICSGMSEHDEFSHFVGFVDREFREFDDAKIVDLVQRHRVEGRLVWSPGHSIENYYFDPQSLAELVQAAAFTQSFLAAFTLYSQIFVDLMRTLCAASLAGRDNQVPGLIAGTFGSGAINISTGTVSINSPIWKTRLLSKTKGNIQLAESIITSYLAWRERLADAQPTVLRWQCHGHVGFAATWIAYSRCVYEAGGDADEANCVLTVGEAARQSISADIWARKAVLEEAEYPREIFELLALVPSET
jgi:hypothetical protein